MKKHFGHRIDYNNALNNKLIEIGKRECKDNNSESFGGKPDRWFENPKWKCINNHVSRRYLKSEEKGDLCLACFNTCYLTYPEDVEGALVYKV